MSQNHPLNVSIQRLFWIKKNAGNADYKGKERKYLHVIAMLVLIKILCLIVNPE